MKESFENPAVNDEQREGNTNEIPSSERAPAPENLPTVESIEGGVREKVLNDFRQFEAAKFDARFGESTPIILEEMSRKNDEAFEMAAANDSDYGGEYKTAA